MAKPLVFISYSPEDEDLKDQLLSHLDVLSRAGLVELWSADQIGAGAEWQTEIDNSIDQAKVALLLVTANFLNSDFILDEEVPALLQRHEEAGLIIVPVIAKACAWQRVDWLARLVGHPERVKPIWRGPDTPVDETLAALANYVAKIVAGETPLDSDWPPPERTTERPAGDSVAGDKVMGDKIAGDKIEGDKIGGDKVLGDKKNVLQIGTLNVPLVPLIIALIVILAILGFVSYRTFSPAVVPTPIPSSPTKNHFDVLVAEIGQLGSEGQLRSSETGAAISEQIFESFREELTSLPPSLQNDFNPSVWHDNLFPLPDRQKIGLIANETTAAERAQTIGAEMVIYGTLDETGDPTRFIPQFYIAPIKGEALEITGSEEFGSPIDILEGDGGNLGGFNLDIKLRNRATALSLFSLGLMYDFIGFHGNALEVFQGALETPDFRRTGAAPVFHYFAGRSALFLDQTSDGETDTSNYQELALNNFQTALNGGYPRAHIGLGSVYLAQAEALSAPERLETDTLAQAILHYQTAADNPVLSATQRTAARIGLGNAYQLKGSTLAQTEEKEEALLWLDKAVQEFEATLEPLRSMEQFRYLGQAYLSLGATYTLAGRLRFDSNELSTSKILYEKAHEAFDACVALASLAPADDTLTQEIINSQRGCKQGIVIVTEAESILEEN
ncbi:MAG: toll/interleukin-1 receptor domain-containing protein [Anaerolineae bacterium]|nr:toll/interleukin-1 receptor domain-containing protein [Anaerolineae bacterium]